MGLWAQFRMVVAERLITLAMDIMPKDSMETTVWFLHIRAATLELQRLNDTIRRG